MGCLSCAWCFTKVLLFCLFITYLPGIPPHAEYKEYNVVRPQRLNAEFLAKSHLDNAEHLFEENLTGPEAFAIHDGKVYTGVHGGWVVQIDGNKLVPVVKFGKDCESIVEENLCGRPLGLKFDNAGNLYVADAYYGIFKYNIQKGVKSLLVDVNLEIEGKKSVFVNDLAVAKDGTVYFTVSSTTFPLHEGVHSVLSAGDGRLMKYDANSKKATVLAEGLLLPNGIALSANEDFLVFSEVVGARVMRFDLTGAQKGKVRVFAEGLPGLPDNIRADGRGGFFVALVVPADETHPAVPVILGPFPKIRQFLARVLYLLELPFVQINNIYPNYFCQFMAHSIGHFSSIRAFSPTGVTILHLDSQGQIKDALIGKDGSINHVSDMIIHGDNILLGSPYNNFIGRVSRPNAPHQVHIKSVRYEEATPEEKRRDEEERKAAEERKAKKSREEELAKQREAEEVARKAAVQAQLKKEAEAAARRAEEENKARIAAEEAKKKAAEEARVRKAAEEAKARKAAEESARRAAEEAKAKKLAEEAARRAAEEAKAKKLAEEAKLRKAAEEAKAKKAADEELQKKRSTEESLKRKAAEEAKIGRETGNTGNKIKN